MAAFSLEGSENQESSWREPFTMEGNVSKVPITKKNGGEFPGKLVWARYMNDAKWIIEIMGLNSHIRTTARWSLITMQRWKIHDPKLFRSIVSSKPHTFENNSIPHGAILRPKQAFMYSFVEPGRSVRVWSTPDNKFNAYNKPKPVENLADILLSLSYTNY